MGKFRPGETTQSEARELNKMKVRGTGGRWFAAPFQTISGPDGGQALMPVPPTSWWSYLTATDGSAWTHCEYAETGGGVWDFQNGGVWGTLNAYAVPGTTSNAGDVVRMWQSQSLPDTYEFEGLVDQGSGSGAGSGGSVGGCCPNETRVVGMEIIDCDLYYFTVTNDASGNPGPQVPVLICAGFCDSCDDAPTGECTEMDPCPGDICVPIPTRTDGGGITDTTMTNVGGTVFTGGTDPSGTITVSNGHGVWTKPDGTTIRAFPNAGYNPTAAAVSLSYPRVIVSLPGGVAPTVVEGTVTALLGSCDPPTCASVNPDSLPATLNFIVSGVPAPCVTTNATYVGTAAGSGTSRHWDTTSIPCSFMGGSCVPGLSSGSNQLKLGCTAGVYTLTAITGMGAPCNAVGTGPYAASTGEASPFLLTFTVAACLFITGATGTCTVTVSE